MVRPQFDLGEHLVSEGEGRTHHKAWMTGGTTEIDQPSLGQHDQPLAVGKDDLVDLRLDVRPGIVAQRLGLDPDLADARNL
jgi:hypothetical protein